MGGGERERLKIAILKELVLGLSTAITINLQTAAVSSPGLTGSFAGWAPPLNLHEFPCLELATLDEKVKSILLNAVLPRQAWVGFVVPVNVVKHGDG